MYKLILVEDNLELIEGIKTSIDWDKNEIEICGVAKNGILGLQLVQDMLPDIIITDIKMPLMDGLDLLKNLKENGIITKNIVLSGYDDFSYAQKALRYDAVDYLLKPCKPEEILKAVLKAVTIIKKERFSESIINSYKSSLSSVDFSPAKNELEVNDNKKAGALIAAAKNYIKSNYNKELNLQNVSEHIYISSAYLSKLFKDEIDINFVDYVNKFRIQKSMEFLKNVKYKNYEVAALVGYNDEKYFYQMFKKYTGITPNEYRKLM